MSLSQQDVAIVKGMLVRGDFLHDIAAHFGENSARIAEIKSGEKHAQVKAAEIATLPPPTKTKPPRYIDPNAPLAKQIEVFKLLMKDPPEGSRIIVITPGLAGWILENLNPKGSNRKRKPARIVRYAEAMDDDGWLLTGEPVILSKDRLLNGQNRLMACVRANKSFRTDVRFGIDATVFTTIDSGKARSSGDTFLIAGVPSHDIVAPAVRWLMQYAAGTPTARTSYSNQESFNFYMDRKQLNQKLLEEAVARAKLASKVIPRGALAAHLYLFEKSHPVTAHKLAADLDKNRHGALKLTRMLAKARKDKQIRLQDIWINAVLVQVWNAYRAGRLVTAKDLKWSGQVQDYPVIA